MQFAPFQLREKQLAWLIACLAFSGSDASGADYQRDIKPILADILTIIQKEALWDD